MTDAKAREGCRLRYYGAANLMPSLMREYRYALRQLRATPVFTLFAVVTLALGIGVTTGMYAAVRAVISPASGLGDVHELVTIAREGGSLPLTALSWPEYQEFTAQQTAFEGIAAWSFFRLGYSANGLAETGTGECVSGAYFQTLRVKTAVGRLLQPADDRLNAPPVAVISHAVWRRFFDRSPEAIGRPIKVNGVTFTIVGVTSPNFTGLFNGGLIPTAIWIPMTGARLLPTAGSSISFDPADRGRHWILMTARLAPGRAFDESRAEVLGIGRTLDERSVTAARRAEPDRATRPRPTWSVQPTSRTSKIMGAGPLVAPLATVLMTAVGLVLLVACTNLANLMLARSMGRRQESALRLALGASRGQILRGNLAESVLLAAAGGFLGLILARVLVTVLATPLVITRGVALQLQPALDLTVAIASIAATLLALVVAGLGPALQAARANVRPLLSTADQNAGSVRWRGRRYLISVQVAVSVILVAIAGLCLFQVRREARRDLGMDFSHLALVEVNFDQQGIDRTRASQIVDDVVRETSRDAEVVATSASSGLPTGITSPGARLQGPEDSMQAAYVAATPDIFRALGVSLIRGRGFDRRDSPRSDPVVVLGEQTALRLFGSPDVVGRQVTVKRQQWSGEPPWPEHVRVIVGIAAEPPIDPRRRGGVAYLPLEQASERTVVFAARSTGDPSRLVGVVRQTLHAVAPDVAVSQALIGDRLLGQETLFFRVVVVIASVLGTMALVVALAGLYGILSYLVASRTREIGIRMALGADVSIIRRKVLREGLGPVLIGLLLGLGLGALARLGMQPLFLRLTPPMDVSLLLSVPALFVAAGILACYLPAHRASRVDPAVALRNL